MTNSAFNPASSFLASTIPSAASLFLEPTLFLFTWALEIILASIPIFHILLSILVFKRQVMFIFCVLLVTSDPLLENE